ncbi:hypothetical protein BD779DRAFT_1476661 [Infundibulicybe gibba]|nr:hypothetical protein BD779DRAFT_1476661 [Infundibulicybe gibba]
MAVSQRRASSATTWKSGEGAKKVASEESGEPELLKAFKETGMWAIEDLPGNDEITLSRKFGNENIADLQAEEEDAYKNENEAAEDGSEALEADEVGQTYPIRASLAITKTNSPSALNINMIAQEGDFIVDNIAFYKDAALGTELTTEAGWKRR